MPRYEPELTAAERKVLRGMMDEYRANQERHAIYSSWLRGGRLVLVTAVAVGMFLLQIASVIFAARAGH